MVRVVFTENIQRHVACPPSEAVGNTVREVLDNVFATNPQARSYVLDDQAALRKHMSIFVDGKLIRDRNGLLRRGRRREQRLRLPGPVRRLNSMRDTLLVSTRKGLFWVLRRSGGWDVDRADFLGDNVTLTMTDPRDGCHYAALDHGHFSIKMHRCDNGHLAGDCGTRLSTEAGRLRGERHVEAARLEHGADLGIGARRGRRAGRDLVRHAAGGLFKSQDRGTTWQMVRSLWDHPKRKMWMGGGADLPGLHSIIVDPSNSRRVFIAVSTGGIWLTEDGGESWVQRGEGMRADHVPPELTHDPIAQDVHCLVQCPGATRRMWVQHHNGIFVSDDEGRNFREIKEAGPSTFGFPVAVHPREPDTAWFVPGIKDEKRIPKDGRLVVTRTRDGGRSFETLTEGLPQKHAYDVVYRHALALDAAGERLAFGSTTGGLWVSESQGDRVDEHHPHAAAGLRRAFRLMAGAVRWPSVRAEGTRGAADVYLEPHIAGSPRCRCEAQPS